MTDVSPCGTARTLAFVALMLRFHVGPTRMQSMSRAPAFHASCQTLLM